MAATLYYDRDASLDPLLGKTIAIVGYGSQGHAHAQNLRDSGLSVVVGLHEGSKSKAKAEADGFEVATVADAAKRADLVMLLAPDQTQRSIYEESVRENLSDGNTLLFAHGFAVRFEQIVPAAGVNVVMVAGVAPGIVASINRATTTWASASSGLMSSFIETSSHCVMGTFFSSSLCAESEPWLPPT